MRQWWASGNHGDGAPFDQRLLEAALLGIVLEPRDAESVEQHLREDDGEDEHPDQHHEGKPVKGYKSPKPLERFVRHVAGMSSEDRATPLAGEDQPVSLTNTVPGRICLEW